MGQWLAAAAIAVWLPLSLGAAAAEATKESKEEKAPAKEEKAPQETLKTFTEKISYAFGLQVGGSLKEIVKEIDVEVLIRGIRDGLGDKKRLMTEDELREVREEFMKKKQEERAQEAKQAMAEQEKFLAENRKKKDVIETKSGLQYIVVKEGDGPKPLPSDRVRVHYRGTLLDGTEFDSSQKRGQPAEFAVAGVIPGWTEGLQLMKVGSQYRFWIPGNLAYGKKPPGPPITADAMLIFEVDLLEIVGQEKK